MRIQSVACAFVLLLLGAASLDAQGTRRRTPATKPSDPVSTQTATTKEGRTVILKSDGTWEYAKESEEAPATTTARSGLKNSTLSFEAGLVYQSGDVKPVARVTFYLLDDDLGKILKGAGLKTCLLSSGNADVDLISTFARSSRAPSLECYIDFYPAAITALKPHVLQSVTTDFGGKASFATVAAGMYYLMGVTGTPRTAVIWNLKVDLKPGQISVTLDQNNAAPTV
ncbi:MAG: hypothetical protein QOH70_418 [Blastocatellia bacterium]|jgi:hypothetical protein|nr:hypothetical protein [Blastocatellia bacterium]